MDAAGRLLEGHGFDARCDRVPASPLFLAVLRGLGTDDLAAVRAVQGAIAAAGSLLVVALARPSFGAGPALVACRRQAPDPPRRARRGRVPRRARAVDVPEPSRARFALPIATRGTESAPVAGETLRARGVVATLLQQAWERPGSLLLHVARELPHFWELSPRRLATDGAATRAALHARDARLPVEQCFPLGVRDGVSAVSFGLELALALVGLAAVPRDARQEARLFLVVMLAYALAYALFIVKLRFRIPVLPLLFVLSGSGAATIARYLGRDVFSGCESPRRRR